MKLYRYLYKHVFIVMLIGDINKSPWIIGDINLMTLIDGIIIMMIIIIMIHISISILTIIIDYLIELNNMNFMNDKHKYIQSI